MDDSRFDELCNAFEKELERSFTAYFDLLLRDAGTFDILAKGGEIKSGMTYDAYMQSLAAQIMWLYPDGSTSQFEPLDKQIWTELDPVGNVIRKWQWDRAHGQWYDITHAPTVNPFTGSATYGYSSSQANPIDGIKKVKCECGSDAVGSPRHSHYCPKYNPKQ